MRLQVHGRESGRPQRREGVGGGPTRRPGPPSQAVVGFCVAGEGSPARAPSHGRAGLGTSVGFGWGPSLPGTSAPLTLCLMFSV